MAKTLDLDSFAAQTINSSVVSKTLNPQDVCCHVVSHVRTFHSHGPPQRKGVSPDHYLSKIKHVKGVFCVNPCLSAPPVPNVPSAVAGQFVGDDYNSFGKNYLARNGCESSSGFGTEGWLFPHFQSEAPLDKISLSS